jgi:chromate reductase, NAD(P)H dehydrogenase (quinone)
VKLLGISGSLQARSANTALLEVARAVADSDVEIVVFDRLADVPALNPDIDPAPAVVDTFRALVQSADGLIIATPEYAHGLPGSLKNLLDWMVGSGELYGKRVVIVSAAPAEERGKYARGDLERTLGAQGASVLASRTIAVPTSVRGSECQDPGIRDAVKEVLATFIGGQQAP